MLITLKFEKTISHQPLEWSARGGKRSSLSFRKWHQPEEQLGGASLHRLPPRHRQSAEPLWAVAPPGASRLNGRPVSVSARPKPRSGTVGHLTLRTLSAAARGSHSRQGEIFRLEDRRQRFKPVSRQTAPATAALTPVVRQSMGADQSRKCLNSPPQWRISSIACR